MKNTSLLQKIAKASTFFLGAFIFIFFGLCLAQLRDVQSSIRTLQSKDLWAMLLPYAKDPFDKQLTLWKTKSHALQGGAILVGSQYSDNPALLLVDEDGNILHRWQVETKIFNLDVIRWWKKLPDHFHFIFAVDDAHLLPNGDVIFIQDLRGFNNYRGQRLARMDANSHILWQVPGAFSHEIDISEEQQSIYAIASHLRDNLPVVGPKLPNVTYLDDYIEEYTLDGKLIHAWSVAEAFSRSKYAHFLESFDMSLPSMQRILMPDGRILMDLVHPNSVQYLSAARAKALPFAQEGDVLISLRATNAIAVLRPSNGQIVWASFGPWRHQHYVRANEQGQLYLFDNDSSRALGLSTKGQPAEAQQSRVLRYNPFNNQLDVIFASTDMYTYWRGYYYPLAGGSWLVGSAEHSRIQVVSPTGEVEWELRGVPDRTINTVPIRKEISTVRYYPASAVKFFSSSKVVP